MGAKYSKNRYARLGSETKINITSVTRVMLNVSNLDKYLIFNSHRSAEEKFMAVKKKKIASRCPSHSY